MSRTYYIEFSSSIRVHDVRALVAAAQERAIAEGIDVEEAAATYNEQDLPACVVMLMDPGTSPSGCEIQDSAATMTHAV